MNTDLLALANALPDRDLLARLPQLARGERRATIELVAHLSALCGRPSLHAELGYGSLHAYCTGVLGLSEDAASDRIAAARACRAFPVVVEMLSSGSLSLSGIRLLAPHLTAENHQAVLARATDKSRREIQVLVAELAPQPDARSLVRRLPVHSLPAPPAAAAAEPETPFTPATAQSTSGEPATPDAPPALLAPPPPPVVRPTAPERYRVQFTIGQEAHDDLRWLQTMLRREVPSGDPGLIVARALKLLRAEVARKKLGVGAKPRTRRAIRFETDERPTQRSRHVPQAVKGAVSARDQERCAYVSPDGRRCTERAYLEFHHIQAHAKDGPPTVGNIALLCRRHNQYEAEREFGPYRPWQVREDHRQRPVDSAVP